MQQLSILWSHVLWKSHDYTCTREHPPRRSRLLWLVERPRVSTTHHHRYDAPDVCISYVLMLLPGSVFPGLHLWAMGLAGQIRFEDLILHGMLGLLLFADASCWIFFIRPMRSCPLDFLAPRHPSLDRCSSQ